MLQKRLIIVLSLVIAFCMILAACAKSTPVPTSTQASTATLPVNPTITPQPTPAFSDTIVVGTWQEPRSFLAYENSQAIRSEMMEIFQPPFVTTKDFGLQANPVLVDGDLPTLDNGGAVLNDVTVKQGDPIFDPATFSVIPAAAD